MKYIFSFITLLVYPITLFSKQVPRTIFIRSRFLITGVLFLISISGCGRGGSFSSQTSGNMAGFTAQEITYESTDGETVIGYLSKPEGNGPFPGIVLVHGGISSQSAAESLGSGNYASMFIENGYTVLSVHYRDSEFGGDELYDVTAGVNYLKTLDYINPDKIALFGSSHGAYMALMVASELNTAVHAVVENFGFTDLAKQYNSIVNGDTSHTQAEIDKLIDMAKTNWGGSPDEAPPGTYEAISPVYQAAKITCPVLIIHGKNDQSVLVEHADYLSEAFDTAGNIYIYEKKIYANGPHGFIYNDTAEAEDARQAAIDFFNKYLK